MVQNLNDNIKELTYIVQVTKNIISNNKDNQFIIDVKPDYYLNN